jgi:hypothetical protein
LCSFVACPPKEDEANINIFLEFAYLVLYGFEKLSQKKCPSKKLDCPQKVRHYLGVFLWKEKSSMITHLNLNV